MTTERKDELYDKMIAWICEQISDEVDLFYTLHHHFGMSKEELHDHCIESLDEYFAFPEQQDAAEPEETELRVSVVPAGMALYDFIPKVSEMINGEDKTAVLDWVNFASFLADSDYGSVTLERELQELYLPLRFVQNNFSDDVFQQTLNTVTLGNEVIFGAMLFAAGYSKKDVSELGNGGVLIDGYIPTSEDEIGSLSVISIADNENVLFVVQNEDSNRILRCVQRAAERAASEGEDIQTLLSDPSKAGLRIKSVINKDLIDATRKSCTESTAFSDITVYEKASNTIIQYPTEGLTEAQRDGIFYGDGSSAPTLKM